MLPVTAGTVAVQVLTFTVTLLGGVITSGLCSAAATVTVKVQKRVRRRWRTVRTFKVKGKKGRNGVVFSGRIKRRHRRPSKLGRGRYRFQLQAADPAGNRSKAARVRFRIVR